MAHNSARKPYSDALNKMYDPPSRRLLREVFGRREAPLTKWLRKTFGAERFIDNVQNGDKCGVDFSCHDADGDLVVVLDVEVKTDKGWKNGKLQFEDNCMDSLYRKTKEAYTGHGVPFVLALLDKPEDQSRRLPGEAWVGDWAAVVVIDHNDIFSSEGLVGLRSKNCNMNGKKGRDLFMAWDVDAVRIFQTRD